MMLDEETILNPYEEEYKALENKVVKQHFKDSSVIETSGGSKFFYQNGNWHRIDGPAIYYKDGRKDWWLRGELFHTKEDFFNALTDEEKVIALFSEDFHNG
jgi:hypothetical protein